MILHPSTTTIDPLAFEARSGWAIKPEGACKGDVCVPLPSLEIDMVASRLGMPIVVDEASGFRSLGPATAGSGRALDTAVAPHIELPDLDGKLWRIADLQPQKVVIVSWASW